MRKKSNQAPQKVVVTNPLQAKSILKEFLQATGMTGTMYGINSRAKMASVQDIVKFYQNQSNIRIDRGWLGRTLSQAGVEYHIGTAPTGESVRVYRLPR